MHFINSLFLLQGEAQSGGGLTQFLFLMGGMILIMYFVLFRPQMKEQKKRKAMLASIKKHDHVLTNGGIHGVVVSVSDNDVVLKIDENSNIRVKFSRSAVNNILSREKEETS